MKKKSNVMILMGLLLIAAALFWSGRNVLLDYRASMQSQQVMEKLQTIIPKVSQRQVVSTNPTADEEDALRSAEEMDIPDYILDPSMEMPTQTIDGLEYIGYLSIPTLELELPIVSKCSYGALNVAPCRYYGSAYCDNMVIAGHNYSGHFSTLRSVKEGAHVTFTDVDGNVFSYEVALLEILSADAIEEMTQSSFDLTLFSCTVGGQYRVAVRCNRIP